LSLSGSWFGAASLALAHAAPETEEQRISSVLQSTLNRYSGEVHRCFEKALADTLDVAGKVELEVDIGDAGRVTKAVPALDEVKSPVLLACLQESAQTWTLNGIDAGTTLILPLSFEGQMAQFSVKTADAPDHGPGAQAKRKGATGTPPFSVKLLVDEATMRARQASLSLLTVSPANRIAMHKHPGAEILYVLKGNARILGPKGMAPEKIVAGTAVFIPAGMPHAIENMGRQASAVLLQAFAPMGPERVYRDPQDAAGRAAFEVIRDLSKATAPDGAKITVVDGAKVEPTAIAGGKSRVRTLLEEANTGAKNAYLGVMEADGGAEIGRHSHPGSAEILYVLSGAGGELTIGSEKLKFGPEQAIHIPENQPHAARFAAGEKTVLVQIYAPAGPEQRFKVPPPPAGAPAPPTRRPPGPAQAPPRSR
jgi:quercetin dioxygenase-like cupin family protein